MVIAGTFYSKSFDGYRLRMPDIEHHIATTKEVNDHRARTGEQALWTDSQFGGMPTFQLGMRTSDVNAGHWLGRALRMGFPRPADHLLVALLCAYLLAAVLGCGPWISALVAIGFGLSSLNILYLGAGHAAKVMSIATLARDFGRSARGVPPQLVVGRWVGGCIYRHQFVGQPPSNDVLLSPFLVAGIGIAETVRLVDGRGSAPCTVNGRCAARGSWHCSHCPTEL